MTNQPDAPKTGRRHRRLSVAKRNVLLALSVFVFALGLVGSPVGDPPLFDEAEPAAASHCGPGDYQWLCILQENCANSGGTLVGLTCVIPTTTTAPPPTTTQPPPTTTQPPPTTTQPPPPSQCTPSAGEHRHTLFNNQVHCHSDHTCPAGQQLQGHDSCVPIPTPSPTPQERCANSGGTWTIYGCWHQPSCPNGQQWVPAGSVNGACTPCPSGQHSHTTCHADHTCASGQVLYDHDKCRAAPVQCTPSAGEHRHTLFNNQVQCHADHTCETGEHLNGHDMCHADHTCSAGQVLYNHDRCRGAAPQCIPSTGEHKHTVTNLNHVYCHADHTCVADEVLYDHDRCRAASSQQCTSSAGQHTHTVTNLNRVYCHADHTCPTGQVLYDHDRCRDASSSLTPQQRCANSGGTWTAAYGCWHQPACPSGQQWLPSGSVNGACTPCPSGQHSHTICHLDHTTANTCDAGEHLDGHDTCHLDHTTANTCDAGEHLDGHDTCHDDHTTANTCSTGQVLQGHDECRAAPVQCSSSAGQHGHILFNNHVYCHDDHVCLSGQVLQGHDECVNATPITPPTASPPTVSGLRCSAASSDSLTIGWDSAAGAASYEVQASALPSAPHLVPWDAAGTRSGSRYVHTFSSLGTGHVFTLAVRGVNSQDATGPAATVKCSTALRDMLTLECNANALLVAEFSDPYAGTGLTPTDYTVQISKAGDTQSTNRRVQDTFVFIGAEYGAQYTVTVTASHGTGWAQYTETDTVTCPTHTDNWNSPNF